MRKLYRLVVPFILAVIFTSNVKAQWNENLSENLLISESGNSNQEMVQIGKTSDEKIFIAWISWENQNACIKLQLLDKDGKELLDKGGIYVSKQPTPTWTSGYGFAVTQDGCAVIVNSEIRNGRWQPYAYKISQSGEQLWGETGIPLIKENEGDGLNPHVCVTKANNILIGFQNVIGAQIDVKIIKLLENGGTAWGGSIPLSGANGIFDMIPSGNDGMIVCYYEANSGNYLAMKYTANGEEAWTEKVLIDDTGSVKTTSEPSVISDGADGIITGWRYAASSFSVAGKAQRIDVDGNKVFDEEGVLLEDLPVICTDQGKKSLYTAYSLGNLEGKYISLCKYDEKGNFVWQNDEISSEYASEFAIYGLIPMDDEVIIVYRNASRFDEATLEYSKVDSNGNTINHNVTISNAPGNKGRGGLVSFPDQFIIAWTSASEAKDGNIYVQNIKEKIGSFIENNYVDKQESLLVYTDHTQKTLWINLHVNQAAQASIHMTDLQGKSVANPETIDIVKGNNEYPFSIDRLSAGIYLVTVQTKNERFYSKLIIK